MAGIPIEFISTIATLLGLALIGALAEIGRRHGMRSAARETKATVEIAGALVDNRSLDKLTAVIEMHAIEGREMRREINLLVDGLAESARAMNSVADSANELRRAASDVATQIARRH